MQFILKRTLLIILLVISFAFAEKVSAQVFNTAKTDTWGTDGNVNDIVTKGDTAYVGGNFYYVGPNSGYGFPIDVSSGQQFSNFPVFNGSIYTTVQDTSGGWYIGGDFTKVGTYNRSYLVHILSNGSVDPDFNFTINNTIWSLALSPDKNTIYIGGNFTSIDGNGRQYIAAINLGTKAVTAWDPSADGSVESIATTGTSVYVGGSFSNIGGNARSFIAELDSATGASTSWDPSSNSAVTELVLSPVANEIIAGGSFTNIGAAARNYLASIDLTTGLSTAWDPSPDNTVLTLNLYGNTLYVGGYFTVLSTQARNFLGSYDLTTGNLDAWDPNADSTVFVIYRLGSTVYVGGSFSNIGGGSRYCLAGLDATTGNVTAWNLSVSNNPNVIVANSSNASLFIGGEFSLSNGFLSPYLAALDLTSGQFIQSWNPNADNEVKTIALSPDESLLYVGGLFTNIGGQARNYIAALDRTTGLATAWDPNADNSVNKIITNNDGSTIYAGGVFSSIGGVAIDNLAGLDLSGIATWLPSVTRPVYDLVLNSSEDKIYVAEGQHTWIGGFPPTLVKRGSVLEFSTVTAAENWRFRTDDINYALALSSDDKTLYVGGLFSGGGTVLTDFLVVIDIDTQTAASFNANIVGSGIYDIALSKDDKYLIFGGNFTTVQGSAKNYLASVKTADALLSSWNPSLNNIINGLSYESGRLFAGGSFSSVDNSVRSSLAIYNTPTLQFTRTIGNGQENNFTVNVPIALSQANTGDITVYFSTTGGTATDGADFSITGTSVVIPAGSTGVDIPLTIKSDTLTEGSELITLTLLTPANATLGTNTVYTFEIFDSQSSSSGGGGGGGGGAGYMLLSPSEPEGGFKIIINNNEEKTKNKIVELLFSGQGQHDPIADKITISNTTDFTNATFENYQTSKPWDLCKDNITQCKEGVYSVYVKYYTRYGVSSKTVSDSIYYEPEIIKDIPQVLDLEKKISIPVTDIKQVSSKKILFTKSLRYSQRNSDIILLQKFLNENGFKLADSGLGSPGLETDLFGILTKAAVIRFQEAYAEQILSPSGLKKGTGFFGPKTREVANNILSQK